MVVSSCFISSNNASLTIDCSRLGCKVENSMIQRCSFALKSMDNELFGEKLMGKEMNQCISWSFLGGSRIISRPNLGRNIMMCRKRSSVYASSLPISQIASSAFTLGTIAVLPFYTFMVVAPRSELTKKVVASSIPYILLGILYAYLLYLSWTPDTIRLMFASKYWLPELTGIAKMFSHEMTLASAWIHLLAVDLFAARQVFHDGLQNNIETRHSVSLCLLFCPIGILAHFITKELTRNRENSEQHSH